jgi:hypothetical protein
MANIGYAEKLKNPLWQKKRLEILSRDNFTCQLCKDPKTTLHVHHKKYIKGNQPWDYPDSNFQALCAHCHAMVSTINNSSEYNFLFAHKGNYDDGVFMAVYLIYPSSNEMGVLFGNYKEGVFNHYVSINKDTVDKVQATLSLLEKQSNA